MKKLLIACGLAIAALTANAGAPNGIQQEEDSFDWPEEGLYVPCLNDTLNGTVHYTYRFHEVETPSGTYHYISSFHGVGYIYSKTTGNTWIQRFTYPINGNLKLGKGESSKSVGRLVYVPDEGDGPVWFETSSLHLVVNANGELKVERDKLWYSYFSDRTHCVGKAR